MRTALLLAALVLPLPAAANCLEGGCHAAIGAAAQLHGPLAIEQAGGTGCAACHQPAGTPCTATAAGRFRYAAATPNQLCPLCHAGETGSDHTRTENECLSCHDPHLATHPHLVNGE